MTASAARPDVMGVAAGIERHLRAYADVDTGVDTGGGMGQCDLWVTIGGVGYYVTVSLAGSKRLNEPYRSIQHKGFIS